MAQGAQEREMQRAHDYGIRLTREAAILACTVGSSDYRLQQSCDCLKCNSHRSRWPNRLAIDQRRLSRVPLAIFIWASDLARRTGYNSQLQPQGIPRVRQTH